MEKSNINSANTFNEIFTSYYRKSILFVKSYVHDNFIAEDIVSESLVKLWEKLKHNELENAQAYLFTILRNSTLDHLKHESIKQAKHKLLNKQLGRELDLRISALDSCDPSEIFSTEIKAIIAKTLAAMPEKSRRVFELSRFEFKSNKEIAEIIGITVKGVDYHISRALKDFRIALKDYLPLFFYFFAQ
jgi:RNA polymerase sigma-70 factor (ECF subfamily)